MKTFRHGLLALALSLFLLPTGAARAQEGTVLTVLEQIPAAPELYGKLRMVDVLDIAALRQATGLPQGLRLSDLKSMPEAAQALVRQLLRRMMITANFVRYLAVGTDDWPRMMGFDLLEADWVSQPGTPPNLLLMFGGEAVPRGEGLAVLAAAGLAPQEHAGVTVWVKGAEDNALDMKDRNPAFPFWGELGSSVRLYRGEAALVGARAWPVLDLALAVERGEAESLADLPSFRLAAAAAGDPALSAGPVMQMAFFEVAFGEGMTLAEPVAGGLPPYDLYAFADREDASGQQVVLVLTYDDPLVAKQAASKLANDLLAFRGRDGASLAERFPGLEASPSVWRSDEGVAAVVRLSTPPEPGVDKNGRIQNRSRLYGELYRAIMMRDAGFLAPAG